MIYHSTYNRKILPYCFTFQKFYTIITNKELKSAANLSKLPSEYLRLVDIMLVRFMYYGPVGCKIL